MKKYRITNSNRKQAISFLIKIAMTFSLIIFSKCNLVEQEAEPPPIPQYAFDFTIPIEDVTKVGCYTGVIEDRLGWLGNKEEKLIARLAGELTPSELEQQSVRYHSEILTDFVPVKRDKRIKVLNNLLRQLVKVVDDHGIPHPGFKVFIVESKTSFRVVNAWTTGSYIYFTDDMLDFCNNDPAQIIGILAHEVGHTISSHTSHFAQRDKLAKEYLGERWGRIVAAVYEKLIASSLGQENEHVADLVGLVLVAGTKKYDPADSVKPFKKMADEGEDSSFLRIFRQTHPMSSQRIGCMTSVLERARINAEE